MARKKRDGTLTIRIPSDEKNILSKIAEDEDLSLTDIVLRLVRIGILSLDSHKATS